MAVNANNAAHFDWDIGFVGLGNHLLSFGVGLLDSGVALLSVLAFLVVAFLCRGDALGFGFQMLAGLEGLFTFGLCRFDVADGLLHGAVGIGDDLLGFLAGGREYVVAFALQLVGELLVFLSYLGEEVVSSFQLGTLFCYLLFVKFYLLQLVLEVEHLTSYFLSGGFQYFGREADVLGNLVGKRAARVSDGKAVERFHVLGVEKHGTVANARIFVGQKFEVGKVGGHHAEGMTAVKLFQESLGNGTARARLSAPTQLVEKKQCVGISCLQQLLHAL